MKCSIITINYNNLKGLIKTVESVQSQTYRDFEHIIIDGSSIDGSAEYILDQSTNFSYSVSEPDNGIYHAMNKGIEVAKGEYLLFLNSGDFLAGRQSLSFLIKEANGCDLIYGNMQYQGSGGSFTFPSTLDFKFFTENTIGHGSTLIKRQLFQLVGAYNEDFLIVSDWEFFFKAVILFDATYLYIDEMITTYQEGGISVNPNQFGILKAEREKVLKTTFSKFYSLLEENYILKQDQTIFICLRILKRKLHSVLIFMKLK